MLQKSSLKYLGLLWESLFCHWSDLFFKFPEVISLSFVARTEANSANQKYLKQFAKQDRNLNCTMKIMFSQFRAVSLYLNFFSKLILLMIYKFFLSKLKISLPLWHIGHSWSDFWKVDGKIVKMMWLFFLSAIMNCWNAIPHKKKSAIRTNYLHFEVVSVSMIFLFSRSNQTVINF
jgi:hypothetical protein